jgi:hypothetical protein
MPPKRTRQARVPTNGPKQLTKKNSTKAQRRAANEAAIANKMQRLNVGGRSNRRRRGPRTTASQNPYVVCRVNPFASHGNMLGIPDGTNARRLLIDHRMSSTITFGSSGRVSIAIAPCIPSPVWIYPYDTTLKANGFTVGFNSASGFMVPFALPEWQTMGVTYNNAAGNYDDLVTLYGAGRFRVVTAGWSVMYTGTTLTDSGLIKVSSTGLALQDPVPAVDTFVVPSWFSGVNTNYATDQVFMRVGDGFSPSLLANGFSLAYDSVITPLRKGAHGVLKHNTGDYEFCPVSRNVTFLAAVTTEKTSMLMNSVATPATVGQSGIVTGFDNGWDTTLIDVTGGTDGQALVVDLVFCVEYCPTISGSTYPLAKQGPPREPAVLEAAEKAAGKLPLATIGSIAGAVSNVVTVASAML